MYNPDFYSPEFEGIKNHASLNRFVLSVKQWVEKNHSRGIVAKAGRYGGTYAHKDIAFEFASWISPQFKLYLIKEFQRLKDEERKQLGWDIRRNLAKINYRIHTDAIKENLVPPKQGPEVWIPAFPQNPDQRRFLEQLCAWLEARGVPVSTQQRLIPSSQLLLLWEIAVWAALAIVCGLGAPAIVAPVSFWVQWLLWGTASVFIVLDFYLAALPVGMVLGLDGMGKWMRDLLTGALFRKSLRPNECFPILIMEESLSAEVFGMDMRGGSLRVEGNALVVETRKGRWRIEPSRVVGIQRAGLDATVVMMSIGRFLLRPIKILWEGEDGCLRGLYVASRGGWTMRRNLRLDRQLFQMLETWRRDGTVPALAQLSLGPRRLGAGRHLLPPGRGPARAARMVGGGWAFHKTAPGEMNQGPRKA